MRSTPFSKGHHLSGPEDPGEGCRFLAGFASSPLTPAPGLRAWWCGYRRQGHRPLSSRLWFVPFSALSGRPQLLACGWWVGQWCSGGGHALKLLWTRVASLQNPGSGNARRFCALEVRSGLPREEPLLKPGSAWRPLSPAWNQRWASTCPDLRLDCSQPLPVLASRCPMVRSLLMHLLNKPVQHESYHLAGLRLQGEIGAPWRHGHTCINIS